MKSEVKGGNIVVLACGTRGDVQPLLLLAQQLTRREIVVTLITHEAHQVRTHLIFRRTELSTEHCYCACSVRAIMTSPRSH